jgi:hypothetical protein
VLRLACLSSRGVFLALGTGLGLASAVCALAAGCSQSGDPASPSLPGYVDATATGDDSGDEGGDGGPGYTICPESIDASYGSIAENLLQSFGCTSICHVTGGALMNGNLDFTLDAAAIYVELLGPDGGGTLASNMAGSAQILRVAPFDPDASLLYIKLNLHSAVNPLYGSGMPNNAPGTVCPPAIDAVGTWIARGAAFGADD